MNEGFSTAESSQPKRKNRLMWALIGLSASIHIGLLAAAAAAPSAQVEARPSVRVQVVPWKHDEASATWQSGGTAWAKVSPEKLANAPAF